LAHWHLHNFRKKTKKHGPALEVEKLRRKEVDFFSGHSFPALQRNRRAAARLPAASQPLTRGMRSLDSRGTLGSHFAPLRRTPLRFYM